MSAIADVMKTCWLCKSLHIILHIWYVYKLFHWYCRIFQVCG